MESTMKVIYCHRCRHQKMTWHKDKRYRQGGYPIWGCELISDPFTSHPVWGEPNQYCSSGEEREEHKVEISIHRKEIAQEDDPRINPFYSLMR